MTNRYFQVRYHPHPNRSKVWRAICEYLASFIPADGTVLELGSGYCDFINQISTKTKYALDINPEVEAHCADDVQFILADNNDINIPDNSVDVVFASNFFEHLHDEERAYMLDQIARLLSDHGLLILVQPNFRYSYKHYWDDYTHVKAYTHESLPDMLASNGYTIRRVEKRFLPFSFKSKLPANYWLTKLYLAMPWRPNAAQMLIIAEKIPHHV